MRAWVLRLGYAHLTRPLSHDHRWAWHHTAVLTMTDGSPGHFDPSLLDVFVRVAAQFDRAFRDAGE